MNKTTSLLLLFIALCQSEYSSSQCALDKSEWTLVFEDNFDGTMSDLSQNWDFEFTWGKEYEMCKGPDGTPCGYSCMDPSNINLANGFLELHTTKQTNPDCDGVSSEYVTSMLRSKHDDYLFNFCEDGSQNSGNPIDGGYLYGMFEIRCKLPSTISSFPAFWLTGNNAWPPEIDAFEFNGSFPNEFFSSNHWTLGANGKDHCANFFSYPVTLTDEFHTWTVVWKPNEISWFLDNQELKTYNVTGNLPGDQHVNSSTSELCKWNKMDVILNSGMCCPSSLASSNSIDPLIVDYVKIYRPSSLPDYSGGDDGSNFELYYANTLVPTYSATPYKNDVDWNLSKIVTDQYYEYFAESDLNVVQNSGKFIYKGTDDLLWNTYWNGSNYLSVALSWSKKVDGDVTTALNGNVIFYRRKKRVHYYDAATDEFHRVSCHKMHSDLCVSESALHLYYLTGNTLIHWERGSVSDHDWVQTIVVPANNTIAGPLKIDPTNPLRVYYRDDQDRLGYLEKTGGSWSSYSLGSGIGEQATEHFTVTPDGNSIYLKRQNSRLYRISKSGGSSWSETGLTAKKPWDTNPSFVNNVQSSIIIGDSPPNIYYKGSDDLAWNLYWDGVEWRVSALDWVTDYIPQDIVSAVNPSKNDLAFIGPDHKIRYYSYGVCEVLNLPCDEIIHKKRNSDEEAFDQPNSSVINSIDEHIFEVEDVKAIFDEMSETYTSVEISNVIGNKLDIINIDELENRIRILSPGIFFLKFACRGCETKVVKYIHK